MHGKYEIFGAIPVHSHFRHSNAVDLAERLTNPAHVYFATDEVTHTLVIRVSGRLSESEQSAVENALSQFSSKWARTAVIFSRDIYGEASFMPMGLEHHVGMLTKLDDLDKLGRVLRARQVRILTHLEQPT